MSLSKKQEEIVNTNEPRVVVSACAAAGKTACIVERARIMLQRGIEPEKMVVITFTNAAADEMSKRIGSINGLFVGTIHAYAYHLLCAGGHHDKANKYVDEEKFDMLFQLIKEHEECIKPVDYLIVDEAQDCSENEWEFFDIIQPKQFFYCGDLRQCIYEWRDACPDLFYSIIRRADVKTYSLDENYRNGKEILDYAKWIISRTKSKMSDNSYPMRGVYGNVEHLEYDLGAIPKIIQNSHNLNWFVLARTNDQVESIQYILNRLNIPNITFKRGGKSMDELNELLNTQAVKVLTIHSAKGLECENVIVVGANMWKDEEIRLSYVAATRARDNLYWMSTKRKKW